MILSYSDANEFGGTKIMLGVQRLALPAMPSQGKPCTPSSPLIAHLPKQSPDIHVGFLSLAVLQQIKTIKIEQAGDKDVRKLLKTD
ncbi:MAG: hypothetical protein DM484_17725, partial [Candidatus Methylumidiphilus alinenensis]